ncbi:MAG: hypothetical protein PHH04_01190 [Thomasclavelia sp.]|nr:hypothetical protein [Thomasclavelia sp.]
MNELCIMDQMEVSGGGVGTVLICIVVGAGVYKIIRSARGRISIPKFLSLEWR